MNGGSPGYLHFTQNVLQVAQSLHLLLRVFLQVLLCRTDILVKYLLKNIFCAGSVDDSLNVNAFPSIGQVLKSISTTYSIPQTESLEK